MAEATYQLFSRDVESKIVIHTTLQFERGEFAGFDWVGEVSFLYDARPDGLPAGNELSRVTKLEDRVIAELAKSGAVFFGHRTGLGRMISTFRLRSKGPNSVEIKSGLFKKERVEVTYRADAEWSWMDGVFLPTPLEEEIGQFAGLHEQLEEHGDRFELPRKVDFTIVVPRSADIEFLKQKLSSDGYQVNDVLSDGEPEVTVEFSKVTTIIPAEIAVLTLELRRLAVSLGGDLDGWACPVTTG